jgi:hypothetical protein
MLNKIIGILFVMAVAVPQVAQAQAGAGFVMQQKDQQVCQNSREAWTADGLAASHNYHSCPSDLKLNAASQPFKGIRVDPGRAQAPIEIYGNCFYIDNYTTSSFFVPAATPAEWASFVQNHPNLIDLVPCCPPAPSVEDTCGGQMQLDTYQRPGFVENHQVGTFGARTVAKQCQLTTNGRSAQWELVADLSVPCDANLADGAAQGARIFAATPQGYALVRDIPLGD